METIGFSDCLTTRQAYEAMVKFLEAYYPHAPADGLSGLLSDVSTSIWQNRMPGDPAAWYDWLKAVQEVIVPDTAENRAYIARLVADQHKRVGRDQQGVEWYADILPDGSQAWVCGGNGYPTYAGRNRVPHPFDAHMGLAGPPASWYGPTDENAL